MSGNSLMASCLTGPLTRNMFLLLQWKSKKNYYRYVPKLSRQWLPLEHKTRDENQFELPDFYLCFFHRFTNRSAGRHVWGWGRGSLVTGGHLAVYGQQRTILLRMENNLSLRVYFHFVKKWATVIKWPGRNGHSQTESCAEHRQPSSVICSESLPQKWSCGLEVLFIIISSLRSVLEGPDH